jgi:hypothetical protein
MMSPSAVPLRRFWLLWVALWVRKAHALRLVFLSGFVADHPLFNVSSCLAFKAEMEVASDQPLKNPFIWDIRNRHA